MSLSNELVVIRQLIFVGPLSLRDSFPTLSLFSAVGILLALTTCFVSMTNRYRQFSIFTFTARLFIAWGIASSVMILASYLVV